MIHPKLRLQLSAGIYAKTQRSFEEVTLKFINSPVPAARRALKTYLLAKLAKLPATVIRTH